MDEYVKIDADREPKEDIVAHGISFLWKEEYIEGVGRVKMCITIEAEQDTHAYLKSLFARRTPPFTDREIKDWQEAWEIIKNIHSYDFQKIKDKYKMQIFREDHDCYGEYDDEVMLQGWLGDYINEENWQVMDIFERQELDRKWKTHEKQD